MGEDKNIVYSTSNYKMPQKLGAPDVIHQQVLGKTQDKLKKDKKGKAYITLDTFANAGEVIEVGKGRFQYKITMQGGFENGNPTYYIKRTDGEDITNADYLNIQAGDDVHFMSRFTGYELMGIWYDAHGVDTSERCIKEEPICNENDFGCCDSPKIKCRHAVAFIRDSEGNKIYDLVVQSGEKETYVVVDSSIDINGHNWSVVATGNLSVNLIDANGDPIVTTVSGNTIQVPLSPQLPCLDANYDILDTDSNILRVGTIPSGGSVTETILDSVAILKDTGGGVIATDNILAEGTKDIIAPDATFQVLDTDSNTLRSGNIVSGGTNIETIVDSVVVIKDSDGNFVQNVSVLAEGTKDYLLPPLIPCEDADYEILDTDSNVLRSGVIVSGGSNTETIADSTIDINKSDSTLINTVSVLAEGITSYNVADSQIGVNSHNWGVKATEPLNITIEDSLGNPVTTTSSGNIITLPLAPCDPVTYDILDTNSVILYTGTIASGGNLNQVIQDSTVNINKSDSTLIASVQTEAEGIGNFNVPDSPITLNNSAGTPISTTPVMATDSLTLTCPIEVVNIYKSDGTSLIASVLAPGDYNVGNSNITLGTHSISLPATDSLTVPIVDSNDVDVSTTFSMGKIIVGGLPCAERGFIFKVNSGSDSQYTIPTGLGVFNYSAIISDGQSFSNLTGAKTIIFPAANTNYTIEIRGIFPHFSQAANSERLKVLDVIQYGDIVWRDWYQMFDGCENLNISATDSPNMVNVVRSSYAFRDCTSMVECGDVDMVNVEDGSYMFYECQAFNPINFSPTLDVLTNGYGMFYDCQAFNPSNFSPTLDMMTNGQYMFYNCQIFNSTNFSPTLDVLTNGQYMFFNCYVFNPANFSPTLEVLTNGIQMFRNCYAFNPSNFLPSLDVLTNGQNMFANCYVFNPANFSPTLNVLTNGQQMFTNCYVFNPANFSPTLSLLTNGDRMFLNCTLSTTNYSQILINMESLNSNSNVPFHGGNSQYNTSGLVARDSLVTRGWTITDAGLI